MTANPRRVAIVYYFVNKPFFMGNCVFCTQSKPLISKKLPAWESLVYPLRSEFLFPLKRYLIVGSPVGCPSTARGVRQFFKCPLTLPRHLIDVVCSYAYSSNEQHYLGSSLWVPQNCTELQISLFKSKRSLQYSKSLQDAGCNGRAFK